MIKIALTLLFLIFSAPAWAAVTLIANTCSAGNGSSTNTTSAINTTGASLIVISEATYDIVGPFVPTDSQNNNWIGTGMTFTSNVYNESVLYYAINPKTSSSHTFSVSGSNNYASICVMAFKGTSNAFALDMQNGNTTASSTTLATNSIVPNYNNELLVTGLAQGAAGTASISAGFTIPASNGQVAYSSGNYWGNAIAYQIQTTATAENPTWTSSSTTDLATSIAAFKGSSISLIANTCAGGTSASVTTSGIDTRGATLIVIAHSYYAVPALITDSNNNSWSSLNNYTNSPYPSTQLFFSLNPTTGSSQTFTASGADATAPVTYPSLCVLAFSGAFYSALDLSNSASSSTAATTIQPGSITPNYNDELLVTSIGGEAGNGGGVISVDSNFTIPTSEYADYVNNVTFGNSAAYLEQSTAAAIDPTWTNPNAGGNANSSVIASFRTNHGYAKFID